MKTLMSLIVALALLGSTLAGTLHAQDITGDWQGTLKPRNMRMIVRISKQLDGSLQARIQRIDENPADWGSGTLANSASLEGSGFKFTVDSRRHLVFLHN